MFKTFFRLSLIVAAGLLWATGANACNVPVFRYALERWQNDIYHCMVFHRGDLSKDDQQRVDDLAKRSTLEGGASNLEVTTIDLAKPFEPGLEEIWKSVPADVKTPFVVVQSRVGRDKIRTVWQGTLAETDAAKLTTSPDRQEIVNRLLKGHSAVWVILPGKDELATENLVDLIETELNRLQDELPLPPGIGAPGSEVYSEIPLTLRFSVHVLKPGPEADILLPEIFKRIAPEAAAAGQPLVAPIFGRGRVVDVIPGDKLDEQTVEDLSGFICGACSCQVKEQNPGFDLLTTVKWDERLFAPDVKPPVDAPLKQLAAELVPIAAGGSTELVSQPSLPALDSKTAVPAEVTTRDSSTWLWWIAGLGVAAVLVPLFSNRRRETS